MEKLGYQILVTVLLPGAILLAAVIIFVLAHYPDSQVVMLGCQLLQREWLAGATMLLIAAMLGTVMGSFLDLLEYVIHDSITPLFLKIPRSTFRDQWYAYMDSLDGDRNAVISQLALYFFFEYRGGVAMGALGLVMQGATVPGSLESSFATGVLWAGTFLLLLSFFTHYELGNFRKRQFGSPASHPVHVVPTGAGWAIGAQAVAAAAQEAADGAVAAAEEAKRVATKAEEDAKAAAAREAGQKAADRKG